MNTHLLKRSAYYNEIQISMRKSLRFISNLTWNEMQENQLIILLQNPQSEKHWLVPGELQIKQQQKKKQ